MNIVISGGTGFLGKPLVTFLQKAGLKVTVVTRDAESASVNNPTTEYVDWGNLDLAVHGADAVINLAGENLFGQRWNAEVKKRILESRVESTSKLVQSMTKAEVRQRPRVFLSASAVGFYGAAGDTVLTEKSPHAEDFLSYVCQRWEEEANKAPEGVRVVITRLAIILNPEGGALKQMLLPFKLFVGGALGSGNQYFPWIVRRDVARAIEFLLHNDSMSGPVNIVAPESVTMYTFAKALGQALGRPSFFRVPQIALNMALGSDAARSVTASQRVVPMVLQQAGFVWEYPKLREALKALLS